MEFSVLREGTVLVTLHSGSDTTACDEATDEFAADSRVARRRGTDCRLDDGRCRRLRTPDGTVRPIHDRVEFSTTVVEAVDASEAEQLGADTIDTILEDADVESVPYSTPPTASAA